MENRVINREFDHIISLGSFCQTAYQIRRHFSCERAHIFDWWVTPTIGLVELVESGFVDLFIENNMTIVEEEAGPAVMCSRYGLMHYHDFDEAKVDGRPSPFLVRAACVANMSKFAHLVKRLLSVSGEVLFIRAGLGYVKHYEQNMEFSTELLVRFMSAMERLLPGVDFQLLLLDCSRADNQSRVFVDHLNNYDCQSWNGSDIGWTELFDRQKIGLKRKDEILVV
jgi:Putative papain-like cysteine peptidase (DUF1796)